MCPEVKDTDSCKSASVCVCFMFNLSACLHVPTTSQILVLPFPSMPNSLQMPHTQKCNDFCVRLTYNRPCVWVSVNWTGDSLPVLDSELFNSITLILLLTQQAKRLVLPLGVAHSKLLFQLLVSLLSHTLYLSSALSVLSTKCFKVPVLQLYQGWALASRGSQGMSTFDIRFFPFICCAHVLILGLRTF